MALGPSGSLKAACDARPLSLEKTRSTIRLRSASTLPTTTRDKLPGPLKKPLPEFLLAVLLHSFSQPSRPETTSQPVIHVRPDTNELTPPKELARCTPHHEPSSFIGHLSEPFSSNTSFVPIPLTPFVRLVQNKTCACSNL